MKILKTVFILSVLQLYGLFTFAQQPKIEDFEHVFCPYIEQFLTNFTPPNATRLPIPQAEALDNQIDLHNWGEISKTRISPNTRSRYYEIDGMLMSGFVWSDSLYWQAKQDVIVEELLPPPSNDPYIPIQEKPKKKYKNKMGIRNISDLENYTLHWSNGHTVERKPYYISRTVIKPSIELVVDYVNKQGTTVVSLFGFDKAYNYQIRISISFKKDDLSKAIQAINWIADHIELSGNQPI